MLSEWEGTAWAGTEALQTRAAYEYPDFVTQLHAIQNATPRPWRMASIDEAIGVPAIFRAVSLIAGTVGMLALKAFRNGVEVPNEDRPRIIVRPSPFHRPHAFLRGAAWDLATRGEADWWIAKRDDDGLALSLVPMPPHEVTVEEDPRDLRYPKVRWRNKDIPWADFVQLTYMQDTGKLRGFGPLQACGAAVSVAVESQEWAANFYAAGGHPSLGVKMAMQLDDGEAEILRERWQSVPPNMPHFYGDNVEEVKEFGVNAAAAQMLEARYRNDTEAAQMFGLPGSLLEALSKGASLTYQNLEGEMTKMMRTCIIPNYLTAIEEAMSDLLPRSTVAKFHVDEVLRADIKTRYEVYGLGIDKGILTTEMAQQMEGIVAGNVENAPMPAALPQAVPSAAAMVRTSLAVVPEPVDLEVRCTGQHLKKIAGIPTLKECGKLLSTTGSFEGRCPRCKAVYAAAA